MKKNVIILICFSIILFCILYHIQKKQHIPFAYTSVMISGCINNKTITEASRELANISIEALRKKKCPKGISCVIAGSISRPELLEKNETIKFYNISIKDAFQLLANKYNMVTFYKNGCFIIEDISEANDNKDSLSK